MPIYEFYCEPCNTLFSFYSKAVRASGEAPSCPRCGHGIQKRVSKFSYVDRSKKMKDLEQLPFNQQRLADGMQKFRAEHARLQEEDPQRAANMMKKFSRWLGGVHLEEDKKRAMERVLDSDEALEQKMDALEKIARESDEPELDDALYEF